MKSIAANVVVKLQVPTAWLRKCLAQVTTFSWSAPIVVAVALCVVDARPAGAQVDVWTHHNDNIRSGANLAETELNTSNVNSTQFGKLFEYQVDGPIFGQALVITGLTIPGKSTRNVVFVATMNNSVYAYDADDANTDSGQPIWQVNFNNPAAGVGPVPSQDIGRSQNYKGPYGIMSTPVIDRAGQVIYLVARTKESTTYVYRLHALDITTGQEKTGSPVVIDATYASSLGTTLKLDAQKQSQRPALALANGMIYIAWASNEDIAPYQGWVVAYNATTLARVAVFNTAPSGSKAGIWMSGHAPTVDGKGNIYVGVGNGTWDGKENFGQSILKLSPQLALLDWFTPDNWSSTNAPDLDVGSSGVLLIPGTQYLTTGSKEGNLYVLDSTNLGHIRTGNTQIPQVLPVTSGGNIHGGPVFWQGPQASLLYVWAEEDYLRAYRFNGFNLDATPSSKSAFTAPPGMPGGFLSVSANGSAAGTGIVWASLPLSQDAEPGIMPGVLRAFDANDVSKELWSSASDCLNNVGSFAKYVPPTVANGRVYLSTYSNQLSVYGLLNDAPAADPNLSGTVNCNNTVANLTAVGTSDWVAWGNVRRASGGTISDYTIVGSASAQTASNVGRVVSWTDGTPTASGSVSSGVSLTGRGNGFQFTAPADTTPRILFVYVGGTNSSGKLIARLSDNSGRLYSATLAGAGQYNAVYKINYAAAGTGQQLIVQWLQTSDAGSITLQAAALSASASAPLPPSGVSASNAAASSVTVSWSASTGATSYSVYRSTAAGTLGSSIGTTSATSFTDSTAVAGTVYYYAVTATGAGGTSAPSSQDAGSVAAAPTAPANVSASDGTSATSVTVTWSAVTGATTYTVYRSTTSGTLGAAIGSTNSTTLTDSDVTAGTLYYYSVVATGVNGSNAPSAQDSGYAGSLPSDSGLQASMVASFNLVNLTQSGTSDWVKWPGAVRKLGGEAQLSDYVKIGPASLQTHNDDQRPVAWSDGTSVASATNDTSGVYTAGISNGFQLSAPADTTTRTLYLYVGGWNSGGKLTAHLSDDSSAPDIVDTSFSSSSGQYKVVYTLTYRAASSAQTLMVKWTQASGTGNVTLQAAALATGAAPASAGLLSSSQTLSTVAADLTANGVSDWIKWPTAIRKATGGSQLSNYVKLGAASVSTYSNDIRPLVWSDGSPIASATNDTSGVYIAGIGNGFQVTAPADTTTRTLSVYVGGWLSSGKLIAHLSDGSSPDFVDASFSSSSSASSTGQYKVVYTLTYRAGSPGQRLVVQWTQNGGTGNVTLQGVAIR